MRTSVCVFGLLLALFGSVVSTLAAPSTHGSVGLGHGVNVPSKDSAPCAGAHLNLNYDGSAENGYCWQYGGVVPPQYGAFAECYNYTGSVCGIALFLTGIGYPSQQATLFIWADAGGMPGNIIAQTNVTPSGVPTWPSVGEFDYVLGGYVSGNFWIGYWANFVNGGCGYFLAADLDGFGGCPMTNIAPGIGYPTGWNNVSVVWGPTQSLGIGVWSGYVNTTGACCFPNGTCGQTTSGTCNGQWMGLGTACVPNPCFQPSGACCYANGQCGVATYSNCSGGDWRINVPCDPNPCPQWPSGACCVHDLCAITTQSDCSGVWLGQATVCHPNVCPSAPNGSSNCVDYRDYLHWAGGVGPSMFAKGVAVAGAYAYLAVPTVGLVVIDITDIRNPRILGSVGIPDQADGVAVSGNYAYVTTSGGDMYHERGSVQVVDVSNPQSPQIVAGLSTGPARGVTVRGFTAYVATWNEQYEHGGLVLIDISDPPNPRVVSSAGTPGLALGVAVSGNYAYVADWNSGLQVVDISDPQSPRVVGGVVTWGAEGVAVSGNYAYLAYSNGLEVVDVSNPQSPSFVGGASSGQGTEVALWGHYACVGLAFDGGTVTIDLTNPLSPQIAGRLDTGGEGVAILGTPGSTYAYVAGDGLQVADITNPYSPPIVGSVGMPDQALGVACSGTLAYVADNGSGLQVIDASNPASPEIVGSVPTPGLADAVAVSGRYAYVGWGGGLDVVDVSNPRSPTVVGSVATPGTAASVAVSGTYAYLAEENSGLQVVDVSNPRAPAIVAGVFTPLAADGVVLSGSLAYVSETGGDWPGIGYLQIFDVSDPRSPQVLGTLEMPGDIAYGVAVSGAYAYVTFLHSLQVIDVTDPRNPRIAGSLNAGGLGVTVAGTVAYSTDNSTGDAFVRVIDISDPARPQVMGIVGVGGYGVAVSGRLVYLAAGNSGLRILPAQCQAAGITENAIPAPALHLSIYPNPASRRAGLLLILPAQGRVCATIHDVAGRRVRSLQDGVLSAGLHDLLWDGRDDAGRDVAAGIYLARVSTAEGTRTARVVILK